MCLGREAGSGVSEPQSPEKVRWPRAGEGPLKADHLFKLILETNGADVSSLTSFDPSQIEEVPGELMQEDLATDDVMLLDTWDQVSGGEREKPWVKGEAGLLGLR